MSVKKRLQRLTGETPREQRITDRQRQINELRKRIDLIMSRRPVHPSASSSVQNGKAVDLNELVPGEEIENDHGRFFLAHSGLGASAYHGCRCIQELSTMDMEAASLLANDPELAACNCVDGLYLDTETTGLAGGTGTFAFLIGIGWFEGDSFVTQQLFARDFSEERACLTFLQDIARRKRFLVTFNGKSFDVGLLSARYIMNRLPDPLTDLPHLDLLHPSRRLLGHRLDNARLVTLERSVLGLKRTGDIPGSEIPQRYFDWLKRRDGRLMKDVFTHNRLDVISMATLMVHLTELLSGNPDTEYTDHGDLFAAARLFHDRGHGEGAHRFLKPLIFSDNHFIAEEAGKFLSLMFKRAGRWEDAIDIWQTMISHDPGNTFAVEELAKWYEHRARDFEQALSLVNQALEKAYGISESERDAFVYRRNRLKRRIGIEP